MSTAYSSAKQQYIGNGVTTEWGFDFPIQKHSELKVYLKRSGMPQVLLEEGVDYSFVTENTIAFPIKTGEAKLHAADVLALQRESVFESEYNFSNQQRLEPEEVMHADDNLERQIQELKRDSESSIKVLPTSSVDPTTLVEHVERVYGSVDNIDTVANDKANLDKVAGSITNVNTVSGDIESVKNVANNIKSVVVDATNIADIKTVARSIANVNKTAGSINNVNVVAPSISSVNTVAANISSVNTAASNMAAIKAAPTAASNAAKSAANAANSATISANSAIWAEGTDAQVAALGGVHSSKGWAQQSTSVNISLTNTPYTTNRILEIPQDIKLELNNGTLTLKAGSAYYKCDGNFTKTTTSQDYSITNVSNGTRLVFFTGSGFDIPNVIDCNSGSSEPTTGNKWFNTNNYILYSGSSGNWQQKTNYSLPLAIITVSGGAITSIDQVFNGFGYIGSTVFALPGVKVQAPNGKNKDGTYNSSVYTISTVFTLTIDANWGTFDIILARTSLNKWPNVVNGSVGTRYNSENNYYEVYNAGKSKWVPLPMQLVIAKVEADTTSPYRITSFEPYTVDSVVNSNEFYQLKDKAVTTDTVQTISGVKTFTGGTLKANTPLLLKQDNTNEGGQIDFERSNNSVLKNNPYIDLWKNIIRFIGINSNNALNITLQVDLENKQVWVPTPALTSNDEQVVTTAWFNSKMQVVSALPAAPNANVFYFIPE